MPSFLFISNSTVINGAHCEVSMHKIVCGLHPTEFSGNYTYVNLYRIEATSVGDICLGARA